MKKALITGIAGQDGSYLANLLFAKGYEVHGIDYPVSANDREEKLKNISGILDQIHMHFSSLGDDEALVDILSEIMPEECYHLASSSFVSFDFEDEFNIFQNNIRSTHNLLGILKKYVPECRVFFAGSSEMFGYAEYTPQNEKTPFNPRSIYGISKVSGAHLVKYYREHHGIFACTGILYNHESPRRPGHFVSRKITSSAAKIKLGLEKKLRLGNLDAFRDWGYAPDYVQAMWLMLQQPVAEDYVIATGETHSVREFVKAAFLHVGLNYEDYVEIDPKFYREAEKVPLCGDTRKAQANLGWCPKKNFQEMIAEMVEADLNVFSSSCEELS